MARKKQEIAVISYVHKGGELVRFDDLTQEEKARAATELKIRWLNALFDGKAVFYAATEPAETGSGAMESGAVAAIG